MVRRKKKTIYAFIDASNLFYAGEKSLGWKVDYMKLIRYLKRRYFVKKVYYYAGVELCEFPYSVLDKKSLNLSKLLSFLEKKDARYKKHIQRVKFYRKLEFFGYFLRLKPVKIFRTASGGMTKKANCDVDMTFDLMRYKDSYNGAVILSGDGDFAVVLKYLKSIGKDITILARGERTAREIRQLGGGNFRDFHYLREILQFKE